MKIKMTDSGLAYIDLENSRHWIKDDVIYGVFKPGSKIGLDNAKKMVEVGDFLSGGQKCLSIADTRDGVSISGDARKFLAKAMAPYTLVQAIVIKPLYGKMFANLFLMVDKPVYPTKIFESVEAANKWVSIQRKVFSSELSGSTFHAKHKVSDESFILFDN